MKNLVFRKLGISLRKPVLSNLSRNHRLAYYKTRHTETWNNRTWETKEQQNTGECKAITVF